MAEFPALPLWTDAYLGDTTHLTTIEHGAYLLLLMAMWRNGGSLPDNDKLLARYTKLNSGQWARISETIRPFFKVANGSLMQGRLTDELNHVKQHSLRQSNSAKARWLKTKDLDCNAELPPQCHGNTPTPTPTPTPKEEKKERGKPLSIASADFENFWIICPRKISKEKARQAYAKALCKADPKTIDDGMARYAATRAGQDAQFTAHPATWLNAERWTDQPDQQSFQPSEGNYDSRPANISSPAKSRPGDGSGTIAALAAVAARYAGRAQ